MAEEQRLISRREVLVILKVEEEFLVSLEQEQIVSCDDKGFYLPRMVERIRLCQTLHQELDVNFAGLEVALRLLDTIHDEREQFRKVLDWLNRQLADRSRDSMGQ
jgi:hypothetical protein